MSFSKSYIISGQIGSGAMATVSKAIQKSLERTVAVKQILPHLAKDKEFVARFHREAKAAAGLRHENIVGIIDFGNEDDNFYIVVEYIDGPSLRDIMAANKKPALPLVLTIMHQILNGLEHSHNNGIIHRDIKPANIMINSSGISKIADFGIAHATNLPSLTLTGQTMGTPSYMSPEQAAGKKIDQRSDLFAAGVMFYEMLGGTLPFQGTTVYNLLQKIVNEPHPPLKEINKELPDALIKIVDRALEKDVTKRYFDATEFVYAVENYAFDSGIRIGARVLKEHLEAAFNLKESTKEKFSSSQMEMLKKPTTRIERARPTVAILPLTGCMGCHVNLLDLHDEFEGLVRDLDIRFSHLMDVKKIPKVDIGMVEGCVANNENEERLKLLRENCNALIAIGTCACYGGIPGLRNLHSAASVIDRAYVRSESTLSRGAIPLPEHVPSLNDYVKPVSDVVKIDYSIPGCPSPHGLIVSALQSLTSGTEPKIPTHAVCYECKREHRSVLNSKREFIAPKVVPIMEAEEIDPRQCFLEQGILCMGLVTREGCGARCLSSNFPCQGCMGPAPMVRESGAKWINSLGSLLPSGALRFRDDIVGFSYRYTLPVSMMPRRIT